MPMNTRKPPATARPGDRLSIAKWLTPGYDPTERTSEGPSRPPTRRDAAHRPHGRKRETPTDGGEDESKPTVNTKTPKPPATDGGWAPTNLIKALTGGGGARRAASEPPKDLKIRYQMYNNPESHDHSERLAPTAAMVQPRPPSKQGVKSTPFQPSIKSGGDKAKASAQPKTHPGVRGENNYALEPPAPNQSHKNQRLLG